MLSLFQKTEIVWPVSSSTGAGINELWKVSEQWASDDALPYVGETSKLIFRRFSWLKTIFLFKDVREHKFAFQLRKKDREIRFANVVEYKLSAKERRQIK